jgi:hypothetical protein
MIAMATAISKSAVPFAMLSLIIVSREGRDGQ